MNNVVLVGRLVRDPILRYTNDQKAVADFTLAIDRRFQRDQADFIRVVVWGKQAENVNTYLKKGSMCAVSGSIQTGSYEKNGTKVYTTDVVANEVQFLDSATKRDEPSGETVPADQDVPRSDLGMFDNDDDIPF